MLKIVALGWCQFRNGRLLCFGNGAIVDEGGAADTIVITAKLFTMALEDGEFMLDGGNISTYVARVSVLCDQPEGNLFPSSE